MANEIRQAVIMAAGRGTRLRPLTDSVPKPMVPVAGRPILEWSIDRLPEQIEEVILIVGYRQECIRSHFGEFWHGRKIRYVEQKELKGTGHAIHVCRPLLDERFVVMNGDDLYETTDITEAIKYPASLLVKHQENAGRFGTLHVSPDGRLLAIEENSINGSGPINIGFYVLNSKFFNYDLVPIKNGEEFGLPQTLVLMAQDHEVKTVQANFWLPIGYPEDVEKATMVLEGELERA